MKILKKVTIFDNIKNSYKTIHRYKWNSIFFHYSKIFLLVIIVPILLITSLVFVYFYKALAYRAEKSAEQTFFNVQSDLNNAIDETKKIYYILISKSSIALFMTVNDITEMSSVNRNNLLNSYEFARNYASVSQYINSISIYSKKCGYVLDPDGNNYITHFPKAEWLKAENSSDLYYFLPASDQNFYICYNCFEGNESNGIIVFSINVYELTRAMSNLDASNYSLLFRSSDKKVLFSAGLYKARHQSFNSKTITAAAAIDKNQLRLTLYERVISTPTFILMLSLCLIISVVIALLLALILSLKAYNLIDKLITEMNSIDKSMENPNPEVNNEILYITTNIINLRNRSISLESELISTMANLSKMQFDILQMQFNPHFLFNALNTINMYLLKNYGMNAPVSGMICLLSEILTESLKTSTYLITISREIEYAKKYLEFQNIMTANRFSVSWNIDDRLLELYTVKFSLQPILENALTHGIKHINSENIKGLINITIFKEDNTVKFKITNNGPQIAAEKLEKINSSLVCGQMPNDKHIGLKNVNKRFQLLFGEKYGCIVTSTPEETVVTITAPIIDSL